jgi:AraC-like DNA-binding protein
LFQRIHPDDQPKLKELMQRVVCEKVEFETDYRLVHPGGAVRAIHSTGHPVFSPTGDLVEFMGTVIDVTDRKRAEMLFAGEKRLLEMIATGVALNEILNALCLIIEEYRPGTLASILLLRSDGLHLDSVAGPSLPQAWREEMERLPIDRHDYVELFLLQGQGSVLIDFENRRLSGKSLVAIGPGRVHAWQGDKVTGIYICFTQEFFDGASAPPSVLFDYPFMFGSELPSVIHLEPKQGAQVQNLFRDINREFKSHQKLAVEMIRHQLRSLMVHLSRLYAAISPAAFAAVGLVRRFRLEIERSFRTSASVRDYARALGVTITHLNESLRLETGLTAGDLIRARLVLEAKRLLLHSELTMAEIGYQLGFKDPSYFSRFIRRKLKTSPQAFRNLSRRKHQKFVR